jgi:lysyl-tRNA synthetase class 2
MELRFRAREAASRLAQPLATLARCAVMPSTVIRRFTYSPDSEELTIEFVTGRRYVYSAVPEEEVQAMREAFSKGVYFNKHIRDRYAYRELV